MLGFDWQSIRERGADGRLVAAGLQWTEKREADFGALVAIGSLSLMGAIGLLFTAGTTRVFWVLLAICVLATTTARLSPGRTRALIFHPDGRTSAPYGFAHYNKKYREMTERNGNLVSIEARGRHGSDYDVVTFTRSGDVIYVAGRLHQDSAHKVAVQLTLALAELRESISESRTPEEGPKGRLHDELID